ncbi:uncharacterized protein RSE6_13389 [Rhynchosporium secalis]|uniref:Uncharacterized protein n=1 Tax=Rhynchosporium secalis TaxID=38038 RepID=A0A1E1MSR6_RHYSE|nr:uncharacterized protein RSE6_13389 [Rhynchosporium secalis]
MTPRSHPTICDHKIPRIVHDPLLQLGLDDVALSCARVVPNTAPTDVRLATSPQPADQNLVPRRESRFHIQVLQVTNAKTSGINPSRSSIPNQFCNIFFFSWHPDSTYLYFRFPAPPTISDMRTSSFILVIRILLYPVIRLVGFSPSFLGRPATQHSALGITDHISRIPSPTLKQ